jgi:transcriptional regulator with XRE-family HTH domain
VTGKELKRLREKLGLTQAELAERLRVARNTVNRMEFGGQAITPSMELLIQYVAREAGVDITYSRPSGHAAASQQAKGAGPGHSKSTARKRQGKDSLQRGRR